MRQKTGKSAHRAHRSKLGLRLALTVFLSIAVVEAVVLVPSYRNYESDLLERLAHAGGAAVMATFGSHAHATERDLGIYAKIMIAGSDELTGIALYRLDGALIGTHGEAPTLAQQAQTGSPRQRARSDNGRRLDISWPGSETGLPFSIVGRLDSSWIGPELTAFVWRILGIVSGAFDRHLRRGNVYFRPHGVAPRARTARPLARRAPKIRASPMPCGSTTYATTSSARVMRVFNAMTHTIAGNIGELRDAHKAISAAKGDLEQRVHARTRELEDINETLRREVAERERVEEQLRHDAFHDRVTGLANRALLMDRIGHSIERVDRDKHKHFSLMVLNLDRFRVVNEALGHVAGDELLCAITDPLKSALRPGDTVARLGGDEFAILIEESRSPDAAIACIERILRSLTRRSRSGRKTSFVRFSMGICPSTLGYGQAENMMQDTKLALARAKTAGGSCYVVFEVEMRADSGGQLRLEADLRRAIEAGDQLRAYYQPIVEAGSGRPIGFEALVRWQHPSRGLIGPADSSVSPRTAV